MIAMLKRVAWIFAVLLEQVLVRLVGWVSPLLLQCTKTTDYAARWLLHVVVYRRDIGALDFDTDDDDDERKPDGVMWVLETVGHASALRPLPFRITNRWIAENSQKLTPPQEFRLRSLALSQYLRVARFDWRLPAHVRIPTVLAAQRQLMKRERDHYALNQ